MTAFKIAKYHDHLLYYMTKARTRAIAGVLFILAGLRSLWSAIRSFIQYGFSVNKLVILLFPTLFLLVGIQFLRRARKQAVISQVMTETASSSFAQSNKSGWADIFPWFAIYFPLMIYCLYTLFVMPWKESLSSEVFYIYIIYLPIALPLTLVSNLVQKRQVYLALNTIIAIPPAIILAKFLWVLIT